MRIRLLATIGGHDVGDILDHDRQAAEWLVSAGFAVAADVGDSVPDGPADQDDAADSAEATDSVAAPHVPQQQPNTPARRTGKRAPR